MRKSGGGPLLLFMLALASCGESVSAAPEVVAESGTCPEIGCALYDDGPPYRLAEIADPGEQDAVAERWGYDPGQLPSLTAEQFLVFVGAEVALDCEITLTTVDHQQSALVLGFERTKDSDVCLDVALPSSAVVMLSGDHPDTIRTTEGTEFRFMP
ncbi:MAG: hypothetical protein GY926_01530 [bacterium]|nr:hypothetical protein [bacterium]